MSQIQENGQEKVISYASKIQQNYSTTMRELLASVVFIKHFHHYLWGRKFILRTDHASLKWLVNFREPEGMLARWLSVLSSYEFETQHRKGALHSNADGLSWQRPRKCKRGGCEDCALSGNNCVCVITRGQTEKLKGQGQISVKNPMWQLASRLVVMSLSVMLLDMKKINMFLQLVVVRLLKMITQAL